MRSTLSVVAVAIGCLSFGLSGCGEQSPSVEYEVMSGGTGKFQQIMAVVSPETTDEQCREVAEYIFRTRLGGDARGTVGVFDDAQAARIFDASTVPNPTNRQFALMESHLRCQVTRNPAGKVRRSWQ